MTRRVRFSPFLRAGCFLVASAGLAAPAAADQVAYGFPLTAASLPGATVAAIEVADLDRDADPDFYATIPSENRVIALRNTTGTGASLTVLSVATGLAGVRGLATADFNGDHLGDAASAAPDAGTVMVHQHNTGANWLQRTVSTSLPGAIAVAAGDLDRDGDQDVLAGSTAGVLIWFSNDGGTAASWTARTIATGLGSLESVATADVDGDGDTDVLTVSTNGPVWYENTGGATVFVAHTAGASAFPTGVAAADVDRDGDLDVVSWGATTGVVWHENAGSLWTTHTITGPGVPVVAARLADLDADGDVDVWTARGTSPGSAVYYDNLGGGNEWAPRTLLSEPSPTAVATGDLDRDGDLDVFSASQANGGQIRWFVNATTHRNACFRPEAPVFTSTDKPDAILSGDIDGDGDLDLVSTHSTIELTVWHENPGPAGSWTPHTISTIPLRNGRLDLGDIDGDGDLDVVGDFGGGYSGSLGAQWLENVSPTAPFVPHIIGTTAIYNGVSYAVDVDGDGDLDAMLIANLGYGGSSRWFSNPGNGTSPWPMTPLGGDQGVPADVDRDGDVDMFGWIQFFAEFFWRDNVNGDGSVWQTRPIATMAFSGTTFAGDVDRDGDPEPFTSGGYYRNDLAGQSWTFTTLPGPLGRFQMADLDVDGDPDLPGTGSFVHGWLKNLNGAGTSWEFNLIPATHGGTGFSLIAAVDVDGDRDLDLAAAPSNDLVWLRNAGGQLAVAAESQAPATAQQGSRVSMVRAVVTHLGLPGESNIEPTRVRVLFEEAAGDPLTTAEANALIAEIDVYRDQNMNGVYDPADLLIEQNAILALVDGVHEIVFPTSSKHEIAVGAPVTLFFVMHLTDDASTQEPNRFRVTLLTDGAQASQFRNRTWGAPIRLACPVNVPSGVTVATIPVELMGFTIE